MSFSPLSNFCSHIKNAQTSRILTIEHPSSKLIISILDTLQDCGYIRGYRSKNGNASSTLCFSSTRQPLAHKYPSRKKTNRLEILLKYKNQKPVINKIQRISKPSKRVYVSAPQSGTGLSDLSNSATTANTNPETLNASFMEGIYILSTSKGIMSHLTAFRLNVGGEVLCHIN